MKNLLIALLISISAGAQKTYYVSSSGNDANDGSQTAPFKSIGKVNSLPISPGDKILFNGGDSFYGSLTPKSGSASAQVFIGSYGTGKAVITGFSDVTNWTQSGNIWTSALSVSSVNLVTIGGVFVPIGKWPNGNKVYNNIISSTNSSITSSTITSNWVGAQVVIRKNHWIIDKAQITSQSGSTINFTNPNSYAPQNGYGFFIQNSQTACDQQNEWFFSSGKLGIFSALQPINVRVPTVDNLVNILGNSYITFSGIQFTGSNLSTVNITSGHDITFDGCDFVFQGTNGLTVQNSANHITLNNCTSDYTNNNFVSAGGSANWTITGCNVGRTGAVSGMGSSSDGNYIAISNVGANSLIRGNRISQTGYIGIDFRGPSITVDKNIIDTFCSVKDDGAAIYTFTGATPTTYSQRYVTNNEVSNGGGAANGTNTTNSDAFGIYMDNNASDVTISDNYIHDCGSAGIFLHGNRNLTITGNVVYNAVQTGGYGQILILTDKTFGAMRNVTITQNRFISKTSSQVAGYFKTDSSNYNKWGRFDSNIYAGNKFVIGGASGTLASWQSTSGMEIKSVTGSPQTTPPVPGNPNPPPVFTNVAQSKAFIKNNCTSGTGTSVMYVVAAGKYSASTQTGADQLATSDINNNGQNYANLNGACIPKTIIKVVIYYSDGSTVIQQ